jgi:hypothetical protein
MSQQRVIVYYIDMEGDCEVKSKTYRRGDHPADRLAVEYHGDFVVIHERFAKGTGKNNKQTGYPSQVVVRVEGI